jgi:hypothetical protein
VLLGDLPRDFAAGHADPLGRFHLGLREPIDLDVRRKPP